MTDLPPSWQAVLADELGQSYFAELRDFLATERRQFQVFPPENEVFTALQLTAFEDVKVVILGQDPYHDVGQAHGLCFSVQPGVKPPPSLKNIFKELHADIGCPIPDHGCLEAWARQGVLLLNTVLTVRAHAANSHKNRGWERFTDAVLRTVNGKLEPVVFVLWGAHAQKKAELIDARRHAILPSAHPSPLSAHNGFLGSRPFSKINAILREVGHVEIDWGDQRSAAHRASNGEPGA